MTHSGERCRAVLHPHVENGQGDSRLFVQCTVALVECETQCRLQTRPGLADVTGLPGEQADGQTLERGRIPGGRRVRQFAGADEVLGLHPLDDRLQQEAFALLGFGTHGPGPEPMLRSQEVVPGEMGGVGRRLQFGGQLWIRMLGPPSPMGQRTAAYGPHAGAGVEFPLPVFGQRRVDRLSDEIVRAADLPQGVHLDETGCGRAGQRRRGVGHLRHPTQSDEVGRFRHPAAARRVAAPVGRPDSACG